MKRLHHHMEAEYANNRWPCNNMHPWHHSICQLPPHQKFIQKKPRFINIDTKHILSISAKMYSRNYDKQVKHNRVFHLICFLYSHSEKASPLFMHNNPHTNTSRDYTDKSTDAGCALSMECVMMMGQVVHTYPNFTASNAVVLMPFSTVNPVRKICVTPADSSQLWSSVVLRPATSTNAEYSSMYYT